VGIEPPQPPDAVHADAFVVFQDSVELVPLGTAEGAAAILTVGFAEEFPLIVTMAEVVPPSVTFTA
jgi:hypothetical protein